jgi:hypothetical protein
MVDKSLTSTVRCRTLVAVLLAAAGLLFSHAIAQAQPAGRLPDCLRQLLDGRGGEIVCVLPTRLTPRERDDLRAVVRDPTMDAHCTVSIRIARKLVEDAVRATGRYVFTSPPQPVTCEIVTKRGNIPIKGQFAPRVVFENGKAVDGSPGLQQVAGATSVVAWPVIQYVNHSGVTREVMLKIINALKEQHGMKIVRRP